MLIKLNISTLLLAFLLVVTAGAQETPTPTLTDVQRLTLSNKYLAYENAKLRLDAAQADLLALIQSLQKPGYSLDIASMTYSPVKEEK